MDSLETWIASKSKDAQCDTLVPIGEIIGPWKVVALLGKGGSAEVYRVQHTHHNVSAALKIILSTDERARERFARERELLKIQTLTCFARFIDSGEWSGRPFIVTEELESFELPHKDPAVTNFILAVCNAVASLHAEGYVHRDLKPGNIMRRKDGSYVLIDLGLVKKIGDETAHRPKRDSLSIVDGQKVVVGTPGYSAPEQFISGDADWSSDIHAIGRIIYDCFDGSPPATWISLVNRATSTLSAQRFQSVSEISASISSASEIRPRPVLLSLALQCMTFSLWLVVLAFVALESPRSMGVGTWGVLVVISMALGVSIYGLYIRKQWGWITNVVLNIFLFLLSVIAVCNVSKRNELITGLVIMVVVMLPIPLSLMPSSIRWFRNRW